MKMELPDINIPVYAHRSELELHSKCFAWLDDKLNGNESFAMSELVLSGFLRLVTNRKIFKTPSPLNDALKFTEVIRENNNCVIVQPSIKHWAIFTGLCKDIDAKGNDIPDAYFAALAIEFDCFWISMDKGFKRFPSLRWQTLC
ncbi:MAG: TA system VapC family ribonuclease toxin [Gammaproteobacteria bacterium]